MTLIQGWCLQIFLLLTVRLFQGGGYLRVALFRVTMVRVLTAAFVSLLQRPSLKLLVFPKVLLEPATFHSKVYLFIMLKVNEPFLSHKTY